MSVSILTYADVAINLTVSFLLSVFLCVAIGNTSAKHTPIPRVSIVTIANRILYIALISSYIAVSTIRPQMSRSHLRKQGKGIDQVLCTKTRNPDFNFWLHSKVANVSVKNKMITCFIASGPLHIHKYNSIFNQQIPASPTTKRWLHVKNYTTDPVLSLCRSIPVERVVMICVLCLTS